jgi:hypothetical protein
MSLYIIECILETSFRFVGVYLFSASLILILSRLKVNAVAMGGGHGKLTFSAECDIICPSQIFSMRYTGEYEKLTTEFHKRGNAFYGNLLPCPFGCVS